jgi:hypothetical protein
VPLHPAPLGGGAQTVRYQNCSNRSCDGGERLGRKLAEPEGRKSEDESHKQWKSRFSCLHVQSPWSFQKFIWHFRNGVNCTPSSLDPHSEKTLHRRVEMWSKSFSASNGGRVVNRLRGAARVAATNEGER